MDIMIIFISIIISLETWKIQIGQVKALIKISKPTSTKLLIMSEYIFYDQSLRGASRR